MTRMRGFTVIELLVIITVIAVLAAITSIGFSVYQTTTRDSQRQAKATVIAEALEKYYEEHGEYPSCPVVTDDDVSVVIGADGPLETVDPVALVTPQADDGVQNSIECADLTSITDSDIFAYVGDGSSTCQTGGSCLEYTLKYKNEAEGTIVSITSRRQTDIATSGDNTITSTSVNSSRIDVSWTAISNASSYTLQRATNAAFTTGVTNTSISGTSTSVTSLSSGTRYWFKVQGVSSSGNTVWSNSTDAYTYPSAPTGVNAVTASSSQIDVTWTAVSGATSYRVQRSTTSNFAGGTTGSASGLTGTSYSYSTAQQGTQYWFRVYATNPAGESSASSIDSAITSLPAPTGLAAADAPTSLNVTWDAVTNATTYDVEYSTSATFSPLTGSFNNQTATSRNITGLATGQTYYIRVFAENSLTRSTQASISQTTTIPVPSTPTIAWVGGNDLGSNTTTTVTCSYGTPEYSRATTYRTDGSTADNYGAWSAWQTSTSFGNFITGEGMYGKAKVRAHCVYSGTNSADVESNVITKIRPITTISAGTGVAKSTASALITVSGSCASGVTSGNMYKWGQIYHGSAGYASGGGWGQTSDFNLTNSGWSYSDGINVYRISRTICQTPYWQRSLRSNVAGGTLQNCCGDTALTNYNNFVNAGYNYSVAR